MKARLIQEQWLDDISLDNVLACQKNNDTIVRDIYQQFYDKWNQMGENGQGQHNVYFICVVIDMYGLLILLLLLLEDRTVFSMNKQKLLACKMYTLTD